MALTDFEDSGFAQTFWAPFAIITGIGLFIMFLEGLSLVNQGKTQAGLQVAMPAAVFLMMFLFANLVEAYAHMQDSDSPMLQLFNDSPQEMSLAFYAGFVVWTGVLGLGQFPGLSSAASVVTKIPSISVLSSAESTLTDAQYVFVNGVMAPYVEEIFMFGALATMIWFLLDQLGVENPVAKAVGALLAVSPVFASFHVDAPMFSAFWIAAFAFSMVIRGVALLDLAANVVPGVAVLMSFTIGAHMSHNSHQYGGVVVAFAELWQDPILFLSTAGLLFVLGVWAVQGIINVGEY